MQLQQVRIERSRGLLFALAAISLSIMLQSCTNGEQPAKSVHRVEIVDEDPQSATQPLASVLDLDYNANLSWWTWREILLSRLRHHQFEDIDKFADDVRETRARCPGGGWKLFEIYDQTNEPSAGSDVTEIIARGLALRIECTREG